MRERLHRLMIVVLPVLLADALALIVWAGGVWLANNVGVWLCVLLGILLLFALPLLVAIAGYKLLGSREGPEPVAPAVLMILLVMAASGDVPRAVTPHTACSARFDEPPEAWESCDFLCFPEAAAYPRRAVEFTTTRSSKTGGSDTLSYRYVPLGPPDDPGPYGVWFEDRSRGEEDGLCVWIEDDRLALGYIRVSDHARPDPVVGDRVADPAAALRRYRRWVGLFVGIANLLSLLVGFLGSRK